MEVIFYLIMFGLLIANYWLNMKFLEKDLERGRKKIKKVLTKVYR